MDTDSAAFRGRHGENFFAVFEGGEGADEEKSHRDFRTFEAIRDIRRDGGETSFQVFSEGVVDVGLVDHAHS